ncbi:MAG: sodium:alanine symporter family protein [Ruminococcaceae bacterium]|nr:sodium:alanine symporter family protein [Oscillospiraceae bacterium]
MTNVLQFLLLGGATPILLLLCGVFLLIYLKGAPFRHPRKMLKALARPSAEGISPFRTVTLALAGTLGVGNIVGVANALSVGGAGAILWMWVSALAAMLLKYAEILLAVRHRHPSGAGWRGGAIYYIREGLEHRGHPRAAALASAIFACLLLLNAFSMGCIIQTHAVTSALEGTLGIKPLLCGFFLLIAAIPVIGRGASGISALTEYLVPIMAAGYLILSVAVLLLRAEQLPQALGAIFRDALHPTSAAGGVLGFLTSRALRTGTMRGLLSNEGGCGTAPTAHAAANTDSPAAQGVWGIVEVFVDTILLCTLTALVILVSPIYPAALEGDAVMLTVGAFTSVLGKWSGIFLGAAIFCFGYATVICWAGYGTETLTAVGRGKTCQRLFLLAFLLSIPLGGTIAPNLIWQLSDLAIAALTTVNLAAILLMRREIRRETFTFFH